MWEKKKIFLVLLVMINMLGCNATDTNLTTTANVGDLTNLSVTATVSSVPPTIQSIQLCDGTCADYKALDSNTAFTIKVEVIDSDYDVNWATGHIEIYQTADSNTDSLDWEHIEAENLTYADGDGCISDANINCITFSAGYWTTKFLAGGADVYYTVKDSSDNFDEYELTYSESSAGILVNQTTGITQDSTNATYSGNPSSTGNAILSDQTNNYIVITHNGNVTIDVNLTCDNFTYGGYSIDYNNQYYHPSDSYEDSNRCSLSQFNINSDFARGTYPTSNSFNEFFWLDIPANQMTGSYTSTLVFSAGMA